ncbi:MAG: hypothetical protein [Circular genetic element sp.]|nr:MAG: hypothetical protein [Circular genetic element sp.]
MRCFTFANLTMFHFSFHCVTSIATLVSQSRHSKKIRTPHCIDSTLPSIVPHMHTMRTLSSASKIMTVLIQKPPAMDSLQSSDCQNNSCTCSFEGEQASLSLHFQ